jgi:hypothetical protein
VTPGIECALPSTPFELPSGNRRSPMSNQHSVTKRNRRPKSGKRKDYTAQTMAAVKKLSQAKVTEPVSPPSKSV